MPSGILTYKRIWKEQDSHKWTVFIKDISSKEKEEISFFVEKNCWAFNG